MAQLITWINSGYVGDLAPGQSDYWIAFGGGLQPGDVITAMAHPIVGDPNAPERIVQVENVQAEGTSDGGRRIFYSVRNAGNVALVGYTVTLMMLRP